VAAAGAGVMRVMLALTLRLLLATGIYCLPTGGVYTGWSSIIADARVRILVGAEGQPGCRA